MIQFAGTPVFILAGGEGQRLSPLTEMKPKPAVPFGGLHRILDFTLSNCVNSNLRKIYVLTQYQREPLHEYVRENHAPLAERFQWNNGERLECVPPVSGKRYRGTADAVFQNLPLILEEVDDYVLIACGDHIYTMDYRKLIAHHASSGAVMTMASVRRPSNEASAFGVVDVAADGRVIGFREKPPASEIPASDEVLVNMGVYVFNRSDLIQIAANVHPMETDFGRHIIPKLISTCKVASYNFDGDGRKYWRDVGSLDSYFRASMDLVGSRPVFDPESNPDWPIYPFGKSAVVRHGLSRIATQAITGNSGIQQSVVSKGAHIEDGAFVKNSVILPGAYVGSGAHVQNAIVAEGAAVPRGCRIGENMDEDKKRFLVTEAGVVVVNTHLARTQGLAMRDQPALPAA